MKTKRNRFGVKKGGFSFIDLIIVVATVLLFVTVALPWLASHGPTRSPRIVCLSHLKQVSLAFLIWAHDNGGKMPMTVSTNAGGTLEYGETAQVFRLFLAMSNEIYTPKNLFCPADRQRTQAGNWIPGFNNKNISYFVRLEADETKPQTILTGDRDIAGGVRANGSIMCFTNGAPANWPGILHKYGGNVGLGDGSVQQMTDLSLQKQLQAEFQSVTNEVIRLAIP